MSLSRKNLDKLNKFVKNENLMINPREVQCKKVDKSHKNSSFHSEAEDPSNIFYSLIDNAETLSQTTEVNHLLKKCEADYTHTKTNKTNYSTHLSIEDELYDEFNYLLEE